MKIVRCIYPPAGKVIVEGIDLTGEDIKSPFTNYKSRLEIYNIHGELVCITNDREKIKKLKLNKGFYLLRETDMAGRVLNSNKIVF
jgi:hypothetical protein